MHVGFNELSLHGQVPIGDAPKILTMMLECREIVRRFGGALRLRREVLSQRLSGTMTLLDVIQRIPSHDSRKRLLLSWMTKEGPFLEDSREHLPDTLYECLGIVVTDWTLAELAHRHQISGGASISAVSLRPSNMDVDPLEVIRRDDEYSSVAFAVQNHRGPDAGRVARRYRTTDAIVGGSRIARPTGMFESIFLKRRF